MTGKAFPLHSSSVVWRLLFYAKKKLWKMIHLLAQVILLVLDPFLILVILGYGSPNPARGPYVAQGDAQIGLQPVSRSLRTSDPVDQT